jgi:hypothetical protein
MTARKSERATLSPWRPVDFSGNRRTCCAIESQILTVKNSRKRDRKHGAGRGDKGGAHDEVMGASWFVGSDRDTPVPQLGSMSAIMSRVTAESAAGAHAGVTQLKNSQFEDLIARNGILTMIDDPGMVPPHRLRSIQGSAIGHFFLASGDEGGDATAMLGLSHSWMASGQRFQVLPYSKPIDRLSFGLLSFRECNVFAPWGCRDIIGLRLVPSVKNLVR